MRAAAHLGAGLLLLAAAAGPAMAQANYAKDKTQSFAQQAAGQDQYEIQAGRVAVQQAQDPRVRDFAQTMIRDHTRTTEALKAAVTRSGREPPNEAVNGDLVMMLSALQSQKGAEFDKAYMNQQVVAHHGALATQEGYAQTGDDPAVRQTAQSAVPMVRMHLEQAEQLKQALGGE